MTTGEVDSDGYMLPCQESVSQVIHRVADMIVDNGEGQSDFAILSKNKEILAYISIE